MSRSTTTRPTPASSARSSVTLAARAQGSLILFAAALAGCASYGPGDLRVGQSQADLRARMGEPTGHYALPGGGTEIEYARGPMGKHTYMIELDAAGLVKGWRQVLNEANFESIAIAAPQAEVQSLLGRPSEKRVGWRGVGEVWSYRYDALAFSCRWFQIWLVEGRVREASYGSDPSCEDHRHDP